MKIFISFLLVFFISSMSIAQNDSIKISPELLPLSTALEIASFERMNWELAFAYSEQSYQPKVVEEVITDITTYLENKPIEDKRSGQRAEHKLSKKYNLNLINAFNNLGLIGSNLGKFLYSIESIPFRFALKDKDLTLLFTGIASDNIYNTLRTTAKERAAEIIESMILPSIEKIYAPIEKTEINYIGMVVTYGSKDFSDKSIAMNLKAEMVALVAPMGKCKDFIKGIISEDEFLNDSDIFQSNRNMVTGIRKIKVIVK